MALKESLIVFDNQIVPDADAEHTRDLMLQMIEEGNILAVVVELPNGNVGVQTFGPPTIKLLEAFAMALEGYKVALSAHDEKVSTVKS